MSAPGGVVFVLCAALAFFAGLFTIGSRSPIRAAVALLFHIIALAGLYLTLHADLLAALQLIVYAGAVVVLFIFVIMLIGPSAVTSGDARGVLTRTFAGALMAVVGMGIAAAVIELVPATATIPECVTGSVAGGDCRPFGSVEAVGAVLYGPAALPFELVSVLLLVAVLGAIAVARGRSPEERARRDAKKIDKAAGGDAAAPAE